LTIDAAPPTAANVNVAEFAKHIDEANGDFKENIMKKVVALKLKDNSILN
jgi:hypothetical protein